MTRALFLLLTLALMCENVNAAPQELPAVTSASRMEGEERDYSVNSVGADLTGRSFAPSQSSRDSAQYPAGAAPFTLAHPLCQTGFWIKQRVDDRDRDGIIIKSRWVFGCAKGKIIYGGKL